MTTSPNYWIIRFNLEGQANTPPIIVGMPAAIAIVVVALVRHGGSEFPAQPIPGWRGFTGLRRAANNRSDLDAIIRHAKS